MIAALFVMPDGPYANRPDVDLWPESRDARLYDGPWPVVAHPPCQRWGRYWFGGPSCKVRKKLGDDGGCFESALDSVRRWGGVLEHPEASHAWGTFGLAAPKKSGGWERDLSGGWSCCVEQGHYGHPARKATWLYYVGKAEPPALVWGKSSATARLDDGYHSKEHRAAAKAAGIKRRSLERLSIRQRTVTPDHFAELLIGLARLSLRDADFVVSRRLGREDGEAE